MNTISTSVVTREKDLYRRGLLLSDSLVQNILARIDIVSVIKKYVKLRRKGKDYFGKCPFHTENSASFSVTPQKQFYHCFGCGSHGNAINFLMEFTGKGFIEVVQMLADEAGMKKLRYGNIYTFEGEPWEIITQTEGEIRRILDLQDNDHYFHYLRDLRWKIDKYRKFFAVLMQHSEGRYSQVYGKSLVEVLGHEVEDEFAEGNMELHPFSDFDSDVPEDDYLRGDYFPEDGLSEFYGKSLTEVLGDFEKPETENATIPDTSIELDHFNFDGLDGDGSWWKEDNGVNQKKLLEEQQRLEELRIAREKNPLELLLDLYQYKEELTLFFQERDAFFESCTYACIGEKDGSLSIGDFGKLVVIYEREQKTFSVVIGSNKTESAPPNTMEAAKIITRTNNMPYDAGMHKDISIPSGSERFGGAQYIVLPENMILIGGQSGDYGSMSREIVEKCFKSLGYSVFFLDNTQYGSMDDVYRSVRNK